MRMNRSPKNRAKWPLHSSRGTSLQLCKGWAAGCLAQCFGGRPGNTIWSLIGQSSTGTGKCLLLILQSLFGTGRSYLILTGNSDDWPKSQGLVSTFLFPTITAHHLTEPSLWVFVPSTYPIPEVPDSQGELTSQSLTYALEPTRAMRCKFQFPHCSARQVGGPPF